jgi:hypothetical protein
MTPAKGIAAEDDQPAGIDKSILPIAEPRRYGNKEHLRFVATKACLVCGRKPSDPHHLRFAQSRALGRKVSEFRVSVASIIGWCIALAMKRPGGRKPALNRCKRPASSGNARAWLKTDPSPSTRKRRTERRNQIRLKARLRRSLGAIMPERPQRLSQPIR